MLLNLTVTVSTLCISEAPILYWDQWLQEFLIGEECCRNFINQDLTFLQPLTVYDTTELDDSISTASDSTDVSVITVQENNQPHEEDRNSPPSSLTASSYDSISTDNSSSCTTSGTSSNTISRTCHRPDHRTTTVKRGGPQPYPQ